MTTNRSQTSRAIGSSLIIAGLFLQASIALKWLTPDPLSAEMAHRLMGVLMGALVVFYANDVPKSLTPLVRMRCDPAAEQALRRFAGWSLALGGAAFAAASILAPYESADAIAVSALGSSVLLVVARLAGMLSGGSKDARVISPGDLRQLIEEKKVTVVDVNSPESWKRARVPGAINLDPAYDGGDLPSDKDAPVVFYCSNSMCRKAPNAARRAQEMGYRNVQVMKAGIKGWVAKDLPTESGE
ncbi:MAG: rhodanese-like domain-containing protein [Vicinamibacteria bacterium]|nr:rhodanese-like domain-containing protein [Vicinamibacteria bacterium]